MLIGPLDDLFSYVAVSFIMNAHRRPDIWRIN